MNQTPLHENVNGTILAMMPKNARKIVDIGCMSGALASEYKKINPNAFYIGVDLLPEYTELAKRYCDITYCLNIESSIDLIFNDQPGIDCWVLGDVLEHLVNPWELLRKIYEKSDIMTDFLICIPNFQHWSIQYKLLTGDLFYEDSGLLDKSHLRIFTRKTFLHYLKEIGYLIKSIRATQNSNPLHDPDFIHLINIAEKKGVNKELYIAESTAYQFVFDLKKV